MHELSIAHGLVRTAVEHALAGGAARVSRLDVVIGALAGVEPEALAFCFPLAARETVCEGAELAITIVPGRGRCGACGAEADITALMEACPACGQWPIAVEGGREMTLRSMEVT